MNALHTMRALVYLYKIVEAGEKGYAVAASNVSNRALKVLFKSYAQQRLKFKDEIFTEIQRLGGYSKPRSSILGVVHRGRIDIFAALTIGAENVEKVVLKEVMLGESVALKAYEKTLKKDLLPETRSMLERQFQEVRKVVDQICLMRGKNGKRLILRLYDSRADAKRALQSLTAAGCPENAIEMKDFNEIADSDLYKGRGTTILETIISGAVGGAIWGIVAGALAAIGIMQISAFRPEKVAPVILLLSAVGLIAGGTFIGSMIGLFIGWGVASADDYVSETIKRGHILMRVVLDESLASRAWRIMNQVAIEARARRASEAPA